MKKSLYAFASIAIVLLNIYDLLGRVVTALVDEQLQPGTYEVEFPAPSGDGSNYPSGVYFYRIAIHSDKLSALGGTGNYSDTKKLVLLK